MLMGGGGERWWRYGGERSRVRTGEWRWEGVVRVAR